MTTAPAPPPASARMEPGGGGAAWWMVSVLFLIYVFSWLDRLIVAMLVTPIKADLHLSDVQISMITSTSFAVFYGLFGLPLGWAADRFPRRLIIMAGMLLWTVATIGCGFARSYEALLFGRVLVGVGEAALLPSAYSLIADAFPRDRLATATSVFQMAGKIGSAAAFGVGGAAIAFATGLAGIAIPLHGPAQPWQLVMMMVGAPGILLVFLVLSFADPGRRGVSGPAGAASGQETMGAFLGAHWQLVSLMLVGTSSLAICGYSMTNWVPAYLDRHFGMKPIVYGPWLSVMNILGALSLVVSGGIVDRLFRRGMDDAHLRFYAWLILALFPVTSYAFFATSPWVFLACYCVAQFVTVPFMVYVSSVMALLAPARIRARMLGLFILVFTLLGLGVGPAIVAMLTDYVFRDEALLGRSLATVLIGGTAIAFVAFRLSLRYLAGAVAAARGESLRGEDGAPGRT